MVKGTVQHALEGDDNSEAKHVLDAFISKLEALKGHIKDDDGAESGGS